MFSEESIYGAAKLHCTSIKLDNSDKFNDICCTGAYPPLHVSHQILLSTLLYASGNRNDDPTVLQSKRAKLFDYQFFMSKSKHRKTEC